jgi:hypothetical protein
MAIGRVLFALLACSGLCVANSIILQSIDLPLGEQQSLWIGENGKDTQLNWVGAYNASIDGFARVLWCVELPVNINLNTTYNTTVDWADTPSLQRVGWLVENVVGGITTQVQGAAFQLAIWDIIEDNGDGFEVGAGTVTQSTGKKHPTDPTVLLLAQQYESQSVGQLYEWVPVYTNVRVPNGAPVETMIGELTYDGGVLSEAPEPEGWWLMAGGVALIALGRWRSYLRRSRSFKPRSDSASTR